MDIREIDTKNAHRHPWERSRSEMILSLVAGRLKGKTCADIGAGDLYFTKKLLPFTARPVQAVDTGYADFTPALIEGVKLSTEISSLPAAALDMVFLLDVLEHVQDQAPFLAKVRASIKEGGEMIITVPAHPFLFSDHDRALLHHRRYTVCELKNTLIDAGFEVTELFFFYSSLFWLRLIERLLAASGLRKVRTTGVGCWRYSGSHSVTRFFTCLLNLDFTFTRALGKCGLRLPGLSLGALCRKR